MNISSSYQCRFGTFSLAEPHDHAALSALLRSVPDQGDIRLVQRREPDFLADRNILGKSVTVIGRDPRKRPMFMCEMREYPVYLGGRATRAVYLGLLRLAREYSRNVGVLEHGFLALRSFARRLGLADEFFTAIPFDNTLFRTIMEAGLPRLPRYSMMGDVQGQFLPAQSARADEEPPDGYSLELAGPGDERDLEGLLAASGSAWSYAPSLSAAQLSTLLAKDEESAAVPEMLILRHNGLAVGCVGVWDQRGQRQLWVEGYSLGTVLLRSLRGLMAGGKPMLPAPGSRLELVSLPFFSIRQSHAKAGDFMLRQALYYAGTMGGQVCALSLSEQNPLRRDLTLKGWSRRIRIYRVLFHGAGTTTEGRFFAPQPELALL